MKIEGIKIFMQIIMLSKIDVAIILEKIKEQNIINRQDMLIKIFVFLIIFFNIF